MGQVIAIVQARMGATRLPGKLLLPLGGRSVLHWVLERLQQSQMLDRIVVATSTAEQDNIVASKCAEWGIACYRGSEVDVLGRFREAAETFAAEAIVRVCADNPLIAPAHVDELIKEIDRTGADYVSFQRADGRPVILTGLGFFAEAMSLDCLIRAAASIVDPAEREHVTLGIYTHSERFAVRYLPVPACCNDPDLRFTLDTPADLRLLREVFSVLGPRAVLATPDEIVSLLDDHAEWWDAMRRSNEQNPKSVGDLKK